MKNDLTLFLGYAFVPRLHITQHNFPEDLTNNKFHGHSLDFFSVRYFRRYFRKRKKIEKIWMDYEKSINSSEVKKDILPDYLLNSYFF